MPQPYEIINLRKRLKAYLYTEISIKECSGMQTNKGKLYHVCAVSPLTGKKEVVLVRPSEADNLLRKNKS